MGTILALLLSALVIMAALSGPVAYVIGRGWQSWTRAAGYVDRNLDVDEQ